MGVRENITLSLNPADLETAESIRQGLFASLGELKNLNILPSPAVKLGGCSIETEFNAIDASIETQLQSIHAALLGLNRQEG